MVLGVTRASGFQVGGVKGVPGVYYIVHCHGCRRLGVGTWGIRTRTLTIQACSASGEKRSSNQGWTRLGKQTDAQPRGAEGRERGQDPKACQAVKGFSGVVARTAALHRKTGQSQVDT